MQASRRLQPYLADAVVEHATQVAGRIRSSRPAVGHERVLLPGEPEARCRQTRSAGITLAAQTVEQLQRLAADLKVASDLPAIGPEN